MKCCVSTDVGTRTNWLTFEPDPDHSPDAGTGLLSPIAYAVIHCNVEVYYVGKIRIGRPSNQRRVVLRRRNTVVGGKYALPSALIVQYVYTVVASSRAVSDPESARSLVVRQLDCQSLESSSRLSLSSLSMSLSSGLQVMFLLPRLLTALATHTWGRVIDTKSTSATADPAPEWELAATAITTSTRAVAAATATMQCFATLTLLTATLCNTVLLPVFQNVLNCLYFSYCTCLDQQKRT